MDPKQVETLNAMVANSQIAAMAALHQPQRNKQAEETKLAYKERRLKSLQRVQAITAHPKALQAKTVTLNFTDTRAQAEPQKLTRRGLIKTMGIRQYKKMVRATKSLKA